MKRSANVFFAGALLVAMAACSEGEADYAEVCMDPVTHERVEDDNCEGGGGGRTSTWIYIPRGSAVPAVGHPVTGSYYTSRPASSSISRGGFGGRTVGGG